ncbi:hypothetical protein JTB14_017603 [Gonioctena quinquepunctata]|nr:hypothetical protein JTB14_017603 [Gonioctena quinquepunctata]
MIQFACYEFEQFAYQYGIQWISSSPIYQQSNGQAESALELLGRIPKKNPEDMDLALLAYGTLLFVVVHHLHNSCMTDNCKIEYHQSKNPFHRYLTITK